MEQVFTANSCQIGEDEFGGLNVHLAELNDDDTIVIHQLWFNRMFPDEDEENISKAFYIEFNGQENGRFQKFIDKIELSHHDLVVTYRPNANCHQGRVDHTTDQPLRVCIKSLPESPSPPIMGEPEALKTNFPAPPLLGVGGRKPFYTHA